MQPEQPTFQQYQQAMERLRRRAHLRRAVITRGVTTSVEMPILDEQELSDRLICQNWRDSKGFDSIPC